MSPRATLEQGEERRTREVPDLQDLEAQEHQRAGQEVANGSQLHAAESGEQRCTRDRMNDAGICGHVGVACVVTVDAPQCPPLVGTRDDQRSSLLFMVRQRTGFVKLRRESVEKHREPVTLSRPEGRRRICAYESELLHLPSGRVQLWPEVPG